jgi:hypothetical protein
MAMTLSTAHHLESPPRPVDGKRSRSLRAFRLGLPLRSRLDRASLRHADENCAAPAARDATLLE